MNYLKLGVCLCVFVCARARVCVCARARSCVVGGVLAVVAVVEVVDVSSILYVRGLVSLEV